MQAYYDSSSSKPPIFSVGASVPYFLVRHFLHAPMLLADDGGGVDEVLWQGDNYKVCCLDFKLDTLSTCLFTRFIEDQDEKREKLVQFFCRNIHNK